jgi:hypothetical protein
MTHAKYARMCVCEVTCLPAFLHVCLYICMCILFSCMRDALDCVCMFVHVRVCAYHFQVCMLRIIVYVYVYVHVSMYA